MPRAVAPITGSPSGIGAGFAERLHMLAADDLADAAGRAVVADRLATLVRTMRNTFGGGRGRT
jgi:NAD(P)-dependent dehydrogenase (short-subunit alcohol dehydrogenase family)